MRTLILTSPYIHGQDVRDLQVALNGKNVIGGDYLKGIVDGKFGPETARACKRAKYWYGYPDKDIEPTAGDVLWNLLTGKTELPTTYKRRRTLRLKAAAEKPLREKALERAGRDVGKTEEPPNSNRIVFTRRWGVLGPYCNMAVSIWYLDAGSKAFRERVNWAYVPYMLSTAEQGEHGLSLVRAAYIQPGDIVTFDWNDDGVADHTGLVRSKADPSGTFETREANTTPGAGGDQSEGGGVYDRERKLSDVARIHGALGFIHVAK